MAEELSVKELQEMYGGMAFYDMVERRSTYIPRYAPVNEEMIRYLYKIHKGSSDIRPVLNGN